MVLFKIKNYSSLYSSLAFKNRYAPMIIKIGIFINAKTMCRPKKIAKSPSTPSKNNIIPIIFKFFCGNFFHFIHIIYFYSIKDKLRR